MTANRFNFRAFVKPYNKIYKVHSIEMSVNFLAIQCFKEDGETLLKRNDNETNLFLFKQDEFELMQSTGLVDKKNNEAFNGDLVKLFDEDENIAQIVYSIENARFEYHKKNGDFISALCDIELSKYAEVIGNIYENKELIKE